MPIKSAADLRSSDIAGRKLYLNGREFIGAAAATTAAVARLLWTKTLVSGLVVVLARQTGAGQDPPMIDVACPEG